MGLGGDGVGESRRATTCLRAAALARVFWCWVMAERVCWRCGAASEQARVWHAS